MYGNSSMVQGVQKNMRRSFCLISLATNMLESLNTIHWKGRIHSFVWSTKTLFEATLFEKIKWPYFSHFLPLGGKKLTITASQ